MFEKNRRHESDSDEIESRDTLQEQVANMTAKIAYIEAKLDKKFELERNGTIGTDHYRAIADTANAVRRDFIKKREKSLAQIDQATSRLATEVLRRN